MLIPCKVGLKIYSLNDQQAVIQNLMGLTVINLVESRVDFKFKFVNCYNFDVGISRGVVSIPRKQNGILIDIGLDFEELNKYKSVNGEEKFVFENMNDIRQMFSKVYSKNHLSYLLIDESVVNWNSWQKLLPIKLQEPDYIYYSCQSKNSAEGWVDIETYPEDYQETTILCHTYNNNFTIWESLIRKGILRGDVEINDNQLDRICNPAIQDNNRSPIHHMSHHCNKKLKKIFSKMSIEKFCDK